MKTTLVGTLVWLSLVASNCNAKYYFRIDGAFSWYDAEIACQYGDENDETVNGGRLALPKTADEFYPLRPKLVLYTNTWIGLSDVNEDNNKTFHWSDGTEVTWNAWYDGYPRRNAEENCGVAWAHSFEDFCDDTCLVWQDRGCDELLGYALCQCLQIGEMVNTYDVCCSGVTDDDGMCVSPLGGECSDDSHCADPYACGDDGNCGGLNAECQNDDECDCFPYCECKKHQCVSAFSFAMFESASSSIWTDADAICKAGTDEFKNGGLAMIESAEMQWIASEAQSTSPVWIGLSKEETCADWNWFKSGQVTKYANWAKDDSNCAALDANSQWNDYVCENAYYAMCACTLSGYVIDTDYGCCYSNQTSGKCFSDLGYPCGNDLDCSDACGIDGICGGHKAVCQSVDDCDCGDFCKCSDSQCAQCVTDSDCDAYCEEGHTCVCNDNVCESVANKYGFFEMEAVNRSAAQQRCEDESGKLAVIETQSELDLLSPYYDYTIFVGLDYSSGDNGWYWLDGSTVDTSLTQWGKYQPKSYYRHANMKYGYLWSCSDTTKAHGAYCQCYQSGAQLPTNGYFGCCSGAVEDNGYCKGTEGSDCEFDWQCQSGECTDDECT